MFRTRDSISESGQHSLHIKPPQVGMHGMFRTRDSISESGQLEWRPFHHTLEDLYTSVASYYSLPVLSFRCAVMFAVCRGGVVGTSWTGGLVHECGLLLQPAGAVFQVGKKRFQSHVHSRYSLQLPACTCQLAVSLENTYPV